VVSQDKIDVNKSVFVFRHLHSLNTDFFHFFRVEIDIFFLVRLTPVFPCCFPPFTFCLRLWQYPAFLRVFGVTFTIVRMHLYIENTGT